MAAWYSEAVLISCEYGNFGFQPDGFLPEMQVSCVGIRSQSDCGRIAALIFR